MSSQNKRLIAEELIAQTQNHLRNKPQEEPAQPVSAQKPKPVEKYEPSTSFYKVFSQVMGDKSKTNNTVRPEEKPRLESLNNKAEEPKKEDSNNPRSPASELPQLPQKAAEPEHKESVNKPYVPSVFMRLAKANSETNTSSEQKKNPEPAPQIEIKPEESTKPTVSVFERLAKHSTGS